MRGFVRRRLWRVCVWLGVAMVIGSIIGRWWVFGVGVSRVTAGCSPRLFIAISNQSIEANDLQWAPWRSFFCRIGWGSVQQPPPLWPKIKWDTPTPGFVLPMWWVGGVMLAGGGLLWRRDRRGPLQGCPKCGYDRRGLAEGAVCPECGSTPPPQTPLRDSASPR